MLHVEHCYPHAFYAPGRWGTDDGYMPFKLCWVYFEFLRPLGALEAINTARGIGLAFAGEERLHNPVEDAVAEAFPRA